MRCRSRGTPQAERALFASWAKSAQLAHSQVDCVGYEEVAFPVERDALGSGQLGPERRATVTGEAVGSGAGQSADDAVRCHLAHAIVACVRDVDGSIACDADTKWKAEARPGRRSAISTVAVILSAPARDRGDDPVRVDLADAVASTVSDVQVSVPIDCEPAGTIEHGPGGCGQVVREASMTR